MLDEGAGCSWMQVLDAGAGCRCWMLVETCFFGVKTDVSNAFGSRNDVF